MSSFTITLDQFPGVVPEDAKLGDQLTFTVTGPLNKLEQDEIDVTSIGARLAYVAGRTEARFSILAIERA